MFEVLVVVFVVVVFVGAIFLNRWAARKFPKKGRDNAMDQWVDRQW